MKSMTFFHLFEQDHVKLFHGTSDITWSKKLGGKRFLYLTLDPNEAWSYAYEEAARDDSENAAPVVLQTTSSDLLSSGFILDADDGAFQPSSTWEKSLEDYGSLQAFGNVEAFKPKMVRAPKV